MGRVAIVEELPAGTALNEDGFPVRSVVERAYEEEATGLDEMVGGFRRIASDSGQFWAKAPKLRQQKQLIGIAAAIEAEGGPSAALDSLVAMCGTLLFVREGEGFRSATAEEIEGNFDMTELQTLLTRFSGLTRGDAGN